MTWQPIATAPAEAVVRVTDEKHVWLARRNGVSWEIKQPGGWQRFDGEPAFWMPTLDAVVKNLPELNAFQSSQAIVTTALRVADLLRELETENLRLRAQS